MLGGQPGAQGGVLLRALLQVSTDRLSGGGAAGLGGLSSLSLTQAPPGGRTAAQLAKPGKVPSSLHSWQWCPELMTKFFLTIKSLVTWQSIWKQETLKKKCLFTLSAPTVKQSAPEPAYPGLLLVQGIDEDSHVRCRHVGSWLRWSRSVDCCPQLGPR